MIRKVEDLPKARSEFIGRARFRQPRGEPAAGSLFTARQLTVRPHGDNRDVAGARISFHISKKLPFVEIRHRQIRDDDVGVDHPGAAICLRSVRHGHDIESVGRECNDMEGTDLLVILYEKYQRPGRKCSWTTAIHWPEEPPDKDAQKTKVPLRRRRICRVSNITGTFDEPSTPKSPASSKRRVHSGPTLEPRGALHAINASGVRAS